MLFALFRVGDERLPGNAPPFEGGESMGGSDGQDDWWLAQLKRPAAFSLTLSLIHI